MTSGRTPANFDGHASVKIRNSSTGHGFRTYQCGHCDATVSGLVIATYFGGHVGWESVEWLMCTNPDCLLGSVAIDDAIYPGRLAGPLVEGLPAEVGAAYLEARSCVAANAYTASELLCRKILMHIAVDKGAAEGEAFTQYIDHLQTQGYITPPMKQWTDLSRQHGNQSTHELPAPSRDRAMSTLMFTAELLRLVYEMEHEANKYIPGSSP